MQAQADLTNISALKKICCLKDLFITNAILPYSSLESRVTKKKKKIYKGFTHDVKRVKSCLPNRWMFSISWKLLPRSLIFLTELGPAILLINWHKTTPFFNTSSNLEIRDNLALSNEFLSYDLITVDRWVALSPERLESNPRPLTPVGGYDFQPRSIKYQGERGNVVLTKKV